MPRNETHALFVALSQPMTARAPSCSCTAVTSTVALSSAGDSGASASAMQ